MMLKPRLERERAFRERFLRYVMLTATCCLLLAWNANPLNAYWQLQQVETTVGMTGRIEQIVLPGGELEAKPIADSQTPIVIRVAATYPHGSDFRYDLVYYGLDPGEYNLIDYLQRKDLSAIEGVPPLLVKISPLLPPGQVEPNRLASGALPRLQGYWLTMTLLGIVWLVGLLLILYWMVAARFRKKSALESARPLSLADRLRPMVEEAVAGTISKTRSAELERILLTLWRKKLGLESMNSAESMAVMKQHEVAGTLLMKLEAWLHQRQGDRQVEVAELLKPYQDVPADAV